MEQGKDGNFYLTDKFDINECGLTEDEIFGYNEFGETGIGIYEFAVGVRNELIGNINIGEETIWLDFFNYNINIYNCLAVWNRLISKLIKLDMIEWRDEE